MVEQKKRKVTKRRDTKLEAEGAEFLVLGNLLAEGICSYKAYINFPNYDLIAVNPKTRKTARIQVKSRWATNYDKSFPIKNFDCEFVVHVALNRGYSFVKKTKPEDDGIKSPQFYVFPKELVKKSKKQHWGKSRKIKITHIKNYLEYENNWLQIKKYLK